MNAAHSWFITGTDTGVGKTLVSAALLHALRRIGVRAAGMKPVAAGAIMQDGAWRNEDMDCLVAEAGVPLSAALTTPYLLREAIAPHIAAAHEHVAIDIAHIQDCYAQVSAAADAVVVEGVGGFKVPLSADTDTTDLTHRLGLPVVLVVGLRLGCLSHALLTAEAVAARGLKLVGWVANAIDPAMPYAEDNVDALTARLPAPLLGVLPWQPAPTPAAAAACLDFSRLPGWPRADFA